MRRLQKFIEGHSFPHDVVSIGALLEELIKAKLVLPYEEEGQRLLWIPGFRRWQTPHRNEKSSTLSGHPSDPPSDDGRGWVRSKDGATPSLPETVSISDPVRVSPPRGRTKAEPETFAHDSHPYRLSLDLREAIRTHSTVYAEGITESRLQVWARHVDLLLRVDKAIPSEVGMVIRWVHVDDPEGFWRPNILGTPKLRKKYPALLLRAKGSGFVKTAVDGTAWLKVHASWIGRLADEVNGGLTADVLIQRAEADGLQKPPDPGFVLAWVKRRSR